ncbi:serine beta-lactamase-like protein LACTB, mitochondrial [Sycon ciliatum]|uniref:serine beta-lactamase-like protein LACTB, mitochondrial n=1 Tax=Sycon ciliatum TaxID=27933 RepID=UPI0031F6E5AB
MMAGRSQQLRYLAAGAGGALCGYVLHRPRKRRDHHGEEQVQTATETNHVYGPVQYDFEKAKLDSKLLVREAQELSRSPGVTVSVGVNGQVVWSEGFGMADVENRVACRPESMMRIASISKPITMLLLARLWDAGMVDLDAPVQKYVPQFPKKRFNGEDVEVTTRMLVHHIAGVRHYTKAVPTVTGQDTVQANSSSSKPDNSNSGGTSESNSNDSNSACRDQNSKQSNSSQVSGGDDVTLPEYHIMRHYDSVGESLELFANDALCHRPGSKYLYTTHGWTLVSAVIEGAGGRPFTDQLADMLYQLGLEHIQTELMEKLIDYRARCYQLDDKKQVVNSPYVDNSYKWAGGGLLATAEDIVEFGFCMLTAYFGKPIRKCEHTAVHPRPCPQCAPYIKDSTVKEMWTFHPATVKKKTGVGYGMGWEVAPDLKPDSKYSFATISHTGAAVGASSALVIIPRSEKSPHSVVVGIICNMESVDLEPTAQTIGQMFLQEAAEQDRQKASGL